MDNKLRELSKPVAWKFKNADGGDRVSLERKANIYGRHDFQPLYSQEYVSALDKVAQYWIGESAGWKKRAEDAEKRIAELERANQSQDDHINQQQDRIDSLEKTNAGLGRRLGDAEKRLATPVQLQNCDFESVAIMAHWCTDEQLKAWVKGVEHAKKQIRAAGFTVEGDE
ncbi:TPA: hypothetical protein ACKQDC_001377 [Serratia marcescens]|uniref:hypothetical protein n=1 Tax=Serratia marcescens TaxID=615 RepID=UPI000B5EEBFC|nr:hypothetical protein [Serratia marcescens]ASM31544.1 hypothetical protein BVG84_11175 [Serratia marcescens]